MSIFISTAVGAYTINGVCGAASIMRISIGGTASAVTVHRIRSAGGIMAVNKSCIGWIIA